MARQLLFPGGAGRIVKKVRAPKFYLGLLEIMCWEPHGLQLFKVSVDPCLTIKIESQTVEYLLKSVLGSLWILKNNDPRP